VTNNNKDTSLPRNEIYCNRKSFMPQEPTKAYGR